MMKRIIPILTLLFFAATVLGQPYHIGDVYTAQDGSKGVVFYLSPDGSGGWAVALNDVSETQYSWGSDGDIWAIPNYSEANNQLVLQDLAGYEHTQAIRSAQNSIDDYAAGLVDIDNGWYLPTTGQLFILYGMMPLIETSLIDAGGAPLKETYSVNGGSYQAEYWSSAECSAEKAWCVSFYYGRVYALNKSNTRFVRAVRSFTYYENVDAAYQWSTGDNTQNITVTPIQTTIYTVTVTTEGGCADTVEHTIVVGEPRNGEISQTACDSYEWNGHTYTQSGDYAATYPMANGCDSVVTLHLTISSSVSEEINQTACDSYEWNGQTYTQSGDYMYSYLCSNGCDSVVILHLTVDHTPQAAISVSTDTICVGNEVTLQATMPHVAVGDILCTDNTFVKPADYASSGKVAMGVVFYVDNSGGHGWAIHLHNQTSGVQWGGYGTDDPALTNFTNATEAIADFDGLYNTQVLRNAGDASEYPAAWTVDYDNGWYLPAAGQLRLMLAEIVTLNTSLQTVGGSVFPMNTLFNYWSSTEYGSLTAWRMLHTGYVTGNAKTTESGVRSVRNF